MSVKMCGMRAVLSLKNCRKGMVYFENKRVVFEPRMIMQTALCPAHFYPGLSLGYFLVKHDSTVKLWNWSPTK